MIPPIIRIPHNRPSIGDAERAAVMNVMKSGWFTEGPVTAQFEKALEEYLGAPTCVVNSGSSALMCALLALGIRPGDLVVVPATTYVATAMVPLMLGARVRLVDVELETFNMDNDKLFKTCELYDVGLVIPVHIGGRICLVDNLHWLASLNHNMPQVLYDSAQAMGAAREGCFSFQITKQLTTVEGGCITSHDSDFIDRCRRIKNYGRTGEDYIHDLVGSNFRTTDISSAIGLQQLNKVDGFIKRRRDVLHRYYTELRGTPKFQAEPESPMFCFVMVNNKSTVLDHLQQAGIDARSIWPPLDVQPCLTSRLENGGGPNADYIYAHTISLPLSNGITDD